MMIYVRLRKLARECRVTVLHTPDDQGNAEYVRDCLIAAESVRRVGRVRRHEPNDTANPISSFVVDADCDDVRGVLLGNQDIELL